MTSENTAATGGGVATPPPGLPDRPAGYWERVRRIVDQAPPLTDTQRAVIRAQFQGATAREAA